MLKRFLLSTIIALSVLCSVTGCLSYQTRMPYVEIPNFSSDVKMVVVDTKSLDNSFHVYVSFIEDTKFEGLIQEIYCIDGTILVEYHRMRGGVMRGVDHHFSSRTGLGYVRRMRVYPANVEGIDYRGNFAHLPQNKDGSAVTNIGPYFNAGYQWNRGPLGEPPHPRYGVNNETRGKVVSDDREGNSIWWEIRHNNGVLTVITPGERIIVAKRS